MGAQSGFATELVATLEDATVRVRVPVESVVLGAEAEFEVTVEPHDGRTPPTTVRGRLGMPDHGHWLTAEESKTVATTSTLSFSGEFPMYGLYRFRIWLDYEGGRTVKTAVDFDLQPQRQIEPEVVP